MHILIYYGIFNTIVLTSMQFSLEKERKISKITLITGHEGPRGRWMQESTYTQPQH